MQREDKEAIIQKLGEAYAMTYEPISRMAYYKDLYNENEFVVVYGDEDKILMEVRVTYDSGCSMIIDVAKAVYNQLVLGGN